MPRVAKQGKGVKDVPEGRLDAYLGSGWELVGENVPLTTAAETAVPEATQEEVDAARPTDPADEDG